MPQDKIIKEGERGNEMFFITEGLVEVVIKRKGKSESVVNFFFKKGQYFGEIALISNSRRTSDVNSVDFCILEIFTRADYESLKDEFPGNLVLFLYSDIGPRLKEGLKHYKNKHRENIMKAIQNCWVFEEFQEDERVNALYFVLLGSVNVYDNSPDSEMLIKKMFQSDSKKEENKKGNYNKLLTLNFGMKKGTSHENNESESENEEEDLNSDSDDSMKCINSKLMEEMKENIYIEHKDRKSKLINVSVLNFGDYFGAVNLGLNEISNKYYYISKSACQIGVVTNKLISLMKMESPELYKKLKAAVYKKENIVDNPEIFIENDTISFNGIDKKESLLTENNKFKALKKAASFKSKKKVKDHYIDQLESIIYQQAQLIDQIEFEYKNNVTN